MFRTIARITLLLALALPSFAKQPADPRLKNSFRAPEKNGWTYVHLEGSPAEIGFQNGYLLSAEIDDMLKVFTLEMTHDNKKDWQFFRDSARTMMWPHIEPEYREELQGIARRRQRSRASRSTCGMWSRSTLPWSGNTMSSNTTKSMPSSPPRASSRPSIAALSSPPAATPRTARSSSRTTIGQAISTARAGPSSSTSFPPKAIAC